MIRIYTEYVNPETKVRIKGILLESKIDYTLYHAEGAYKGVPESTIIIEISRIGYAEAWDLANKIGRVGNQETVLVQLIESKEFSITIRGEENGSNEPESVSLC